MCLGSGSACPPPPPGVRGPLAILRGSPGQHVCHTPPEGLSCAGTTETPQPDSIPSALQANPNSTQPLAPRSAGDHEADRSPRGLPRPCPVWGHPGPAEDTRPTICSLGIPLWQNRFVQGIPKKAFERGSSAEGGRHWRGGFPRVSWAG